MQASRMVGLEQLDETSGEREFINCKPLAPAEAVRQAHASAASASVPASRVIYGNDSFYIFFRLHHYLYDRSAARLSAHPPPLPLSLSLSPRYPEPGRACGGAPSCLRTCC